MPLHQLRDWEPQAFFRRVTPEAWTLFDQQFELSFAIDPERHPVDTRFEAWKELPEKHRSAVEVVLIPINDMCSNHGRPYLEKLAATVWTGPDARLVEESKNWSVYDLSMRLYLAAPKEFLEAHHQYGVDMMEHFKEFRGQGSAELELTPETLNAFSAAMRAHFLKTRGSGRLHIEAVDGPEKYALFMYHDDEVSPVERFNASERIVPEWQRDVAKVALVFYRVDHTLMVKAPRAEDRDELKDRFAEMFLRVRDYFEDVSKVAKFDFSPLQREEFEFVTAPSTGIEAVFVTRIVVQPKDRERKRLGIDLPPYLSTIGLHEALKKSGVEPGDAVIEGIRVKFIFREGKGSGRARTISLFNPNSTNLRDTPREKVIRNCLREWGIDGSRKTFALGLSAFPPSGGNPGNLHS